MLLLNESFKQKLKWYVYNKNLKQINKFTYSAFKFKFNITSQDQQEEFTEFICNDNKQEEIMPWDVCNFFVKRNIKYSISFRYIKYLGLKENYVLFKTVVFLKLQKLKVNIKNYINNYKFVTELKKKEINGKLRWSFLLQLFNIDKRRVYFIQGDSNIWWKPKKNIREKDNCKLVSYGWLFAQVGKMKL